VHCGQGVAERKQNRCSVCCEVFLRYHCSGKKRLSWATATFETASGRQWKIRQKDGPTNKNSYTAPVILLLLLKGKGKAVSLQAWTGPEGSRKLRFPDFVTTAQDGGKVVSLTHRSPLPPGNTPGTHFC